MAITFLGLGVITPLITEGLDRSYHLVLIGKNGLIQTSRPEEGWGV